jgi:hypothetical protein
MIKVSLIKKHYQVKVGAKNIVTSCDPATVTATNTDSTVIGTATVASGGTGNIPIADSVISNTTGAIDSLPATTPLTIVDSVITLNNTVGTLNTTNVPATTNLTLTAPDSTTNVTDQLGNPLGQVTGISGATNTQQVTVPPCPDLDELVDTSTNQQVADSVIAANKEVEVFDLLLTLFGNYPIMFPEFGSAMSSPFTTMVIGNELYVINSTASSFIQVYSLLDRTFVRNKLSLGNVAVYVRASADGSQYLVNAFSSGQIRILSTAGDVVTATLSATSVYGAEFAPNGNIFWFPISSSTVTEINQAGVIQGTTFTIPSIGDLVSLKRRPGTNEIWAMGAITNPTGIAWFDSSSRVITNLTITGSSYTLGRKLDIEFFGARIFVITKVNTNATAIIEVDYTGAVQREVTIPAGGTTVSVIGVSSYMLNGKFAIFYALNLTNKLGYVVF